jgi:hypothetical protein
MKATRQDNKTRQHTPRHMCTERETKTNKEEKEDIKKIRLPPLRRQKEHMAKNTNTHDKWDRTCTSVEENKIEKIETCHYDKKSKIASN